MSGGNALVDGEGSQGPSDSVGCCSSGNVAGAETRMLPCFLAMNMESKRQANKTESALRAVTVQVVPRTLKPVFEKRAQILLAGRNVL